MTLDRVRALVFDVFGTVVDWRSGVARGDVARVRPGGGKALVDIELTKDVTLREGASASIQSLGMLGDKYVELAKNSMDEMSFASPALAPNTIFLRTQTKLYRIGR